MLKPPHVILLSLLLLDGGTVASRPDAGADAGSSAPQPSTPRPDAGVIASQPITPESIRWPESLPPLAVLDGPAVVAANAALQHVLSRLARDYGTDCAASAKAMQVIVGEQGGVYFVRIDQHMDRCGWGVPPGFSTEMDWFEMYAVSPDGRILARNPFRP